MVGVLASLREIGPWIEAGKGPEVVDEMRLVEIPACQRDVDPLDLLTFFNEM